MGDKRGSEDTQKATKKSRPSSSIIGISRAISACQRCRTRKVRCDQDFPKCFKCAKAGVECIGIDPATGREVPRSYIIHLEDKISILENLLKEKGIDVGSAGGGAIGNVPGGLGSSGNGGAAGLSSSSSIAEHSNEPTSGISPSQDFPGIKQEQVYASTAIPPPTAAAHDATSAPLTSVQEEAPSSPSYEENHIHNIMEGVSDGTMKSGSRAPPGYLDRNSEGISFGKLMFTAVKFNKKTSRQSSAPLQSQPPSSIPTNVNTNLANKNSSTTRSSSISQSVVIDPSVYLKHDVLPAILPPKSTAQEFIKIYFAQSNSQLPILHREEFIKNCFVPIYGALDPGISLASNYTAINMSIIDGNRKNSKTADAQEKEQPWFENYKNQFTSYIEKHPNEKIDPVKISNTIVPPTKYHRALYFLNIVFAISSSVNHLQYPNLISDAFKAAAVKYIELVYSSQDQLESLQGILLLALYSIMRPAVPGVWYVLGSALRVVVDLGLQHETASSIRGLDSFTKDKRRRLFWCTYSLDRQICFYLGRPVGIPEECIEVPFPSELDDALIIPNDQSNDDYSNNVSGMPTYKVISLSFFKIRQIQSEVQRILLYEKSELPRRYANLDQWKEDISEKLKIWKSQAPKTQRKMNCDFNLEFFNLNYNHALIMLHGISPKKFTLSISDFHKVSESSKELINGYYQLYYSKSINYTWAAVHNLFMAGSSYLYTIYNSPQVRERNSFFEVKKITQECITILNSLIDRCDAASNCKDIFEVLTAAILKIRYNEVVQGVSGSIPTAQQIAISSPAGHVNSNLKQLVETLSSPDENQYSSVMKKEEKLTPHILGNGDEENTSFRYARYPPPQFKLNPFQSTTPDSMSPSGNYMMNSYNQSNNHNNIDTNNANSSHTPTANNYLTRILNENDSTPTEDINKTRYNALQFGSPQAFEWITDDRNLTEFGRNQQITHQYDLDIFFDELENLSSEASFDNPQSPKNVSEGSFDHENVAPLTTSNEFLSSSSITTTPYSNESSSSGEKSRQASSSTSGGLKGTGSSDENKGAATARHDSYKGAPTKEAKRVYELIHQMPTEAIWDQFFTTNGNSLNTGNLS
ncbi:pyrimidine pathway regulatory protein 1 [[Candida] railenensis]|uniref:Pyrimidine pathway regulatory protein 1 n=1 Tax=[Candida] railenensis TaxID=45579 RepID=A0A9P0QS47_9ASCO|nr:pyrimidine pathway regulatory protein 1 [[Candida] railenensis]